MIKRAIHRQVRPGGNAPPSLGCSQGWKLEPGTEVLTPLGHKLAAAWVGRSPHVGWDSAEQSKVGSEIRRSGRIRGLGPHQVHG